MTEKVSKASVSYHMVGSAAKHKCGNCSMYRSGYCTLVKGNIRPNAWCKEWERK